MTDSSHRLGLLLQTSERAFPLGILKSNCWGPDLGSVSKTGIFTMNGIPLSSRLLNLTKHGGPRNINYLCKKPKQCPWTTNQ